MWHNKLKSRTDPVRQPHESWFWFGLRLTCCRWDDDALGKIVVDMFARMFFLFIQPPFMMQAQHDQNWINELTPTDYLECGEAIESGGVHRFRGHVGDVCDELLQIPTGLLQVGGVDDDLHQLQKGGRILDRSPILVYVKRWRDGGVTGALLPQSVLCGASWWGSEGSCSGFSSAEGWWIFSTCHLSPSSWMDEGHDSRVKHKCVFYIHVMAAKQRRDTPVRPTCGGETRRT